jgi:hypothetical protein
MRFETRSVVSCKAHLMPTVFSLIFQLLNKQPKFMSCINVKEPDRLKLFMRATFSVFVSIGKIKRHFS